MEPLIADLKYRLRNFKNEHDPKYNGNCHFDGIKTGLDSQIKLICDRVVGCPVDSCTRHQRDDAGNQKDGDRAPLPYRKPS